VAVASAGHVQVCTSLQIDNHASTSLLSFLQAGCPSCRPTNSVKALKDKLDNGTNISRSVKHYSFIMVACSCRKSAGVASLALPAYYSEQGLCICRVSVRLSACPSVRPSICLSVRAWAHGRKPAAVGLLLWARPAGYIDRLLRDAQQRGVRRANAGSAMLSAYVVAEHRLVVGCIVVALSVKILLINITTIYTYAIEMCCFN